ncbi:thiamine diphosphate-binding protein [Desarmillaria ectypa]|nr:thiamine diphosphate-binding protein [Desarmillaria ectypa]
MDSTFPIDLTKFKKLALDPAKSKLSNDERAALKANIQLLRDAIVLFTTTGSARGLSGHTGGAYDVIPEVCIALALFNHSHSSYVPILFDEAGHRVAVQYLLSALEGALPVEQLLHYREANSKLPGHPELGLTPGVKFSSGRLGHMWPFVNGVALANRDKNVFCLGSDGSQQEGNDAEAARLAVAKGLNVKLLIDDNDVTIAGHPSEYLKGFDMIKTLQGHGLKVITVQGEDIDALWGAISTIVTTPGPAAIVSKRPMAPGIVDIEGKIQGHDAVPVESAIKYLESRGHESCADMLRQIKAKQQPYVHIGSTKETSANRTTFGKAVNLVLDGLSKEEAANRVMVIDSDLEGSTGLKAIHQKHPEVFVTSGVMERGNFSAAAGFGFDPNKFGVFSTFSAFIEMVISEITMARYNRSNVLCHFSHSGVDEIMITVIKRIFFERGMRFVFSNRSKVPYILKEDGKTKYFGDGYEFIPGKDEIIAEGKAGYVVSFGEMLYRSWDAVLRCRQKGIDVGLINKPTLSSVDEEVTKMIGSSPFVLVVETFNKKTGLGSKYGTWLLERGLTPKYAHMGATKEGSGGLWEQIDHQGLDPASIAAKITELERRK